MTVPRFSRTQDWPRLVADAVNRQANDIKALAARTDATESDIAAAEADIAALQAQVAYTVETITFTPIAEPGGPVAGMTYFDSGTGKLRTYDGSTWQDHW